MSCVLINRKEKIGSRCRGKSVWESEFKVKSEYIGIGQQRIVSG